MKEQNIKNERPTLDVVMTTFNEDQSLLKRSMDSVLSQLNDDCQLILVIEPNDENTEFVKQYTTNNTQVLVIQNEQKLGFVASLNQGVKSSSAKYIARLDTDDACYPDRLNRQIRFLEENPNVDVLGGWVVYDTPTSVFRKYPESHDDIKNGFLLSNAIAHPTVVLKRELFDKFGYYDESFSYSEDLELWLRLLANGCQFHNLQVPLLTYSVERRKKPRLDRVFMYRARLKHNRHIYRYIPAIFSILAYRILSLIPGNLFVLMKQIFAKKVGNLHKGAN